MHSAAKRGSIVLTCPIGFAILIEGELVVVVTGREVHVVQHSHLRVVLNEGLGYKG